MPEQIELDTLVQYFNDSQDESIDARRKSEKSRDYYDNIQLTDEERTELKNRKQPPVVFNLTAQKVDFLLGTERQSRTDPKAYPRTPDSEDAANAVTDAVRFVLDNNDFDMVASNVFENMLIEGTGACSVEVKQKREDIEITITQIPWDRFFYDPHSLKKDFSDAKYTGAVAWKDLEDAQLRWPDAADALQAGVTLNQEDDTYDDKPRHWWNKSRRRVMCVDIYFRHKGKWHHAIYAENTWLVPPEESTYLDEDGLPENPHIAESAKVKRDGQRYGPVEALIDIQDEINKRRSKALHMLTVRQTFSKEGRITDINKFKREANKADGHIEFPNDGEFGKDFGMMPDAGLVGPQFDLYLDAKSHMDTVQANAALSGKVDGSLSGKAIQSLQQGGIVELTPLFDGHASWKKRVYRAVWNRIKQFWREEKWIRVTDDEDNLRFVGLNQPVTIAEQMLIEKTGRKPKDIREEFGDKLEQVYQLRPDLRETAQVENEVAEMDVDIIVEEVPDVVNLQSEQFEQLVNMYQANPEGIPWEAVVQMSTLRNKDRILGKELTPEERQAQEAQQQEAQELARLEKANMKADAVGKIAKAEKDRADAEATRLSTTADVQALEKLVADSR